MGACLIFRGRHARLASQPNSCVISTEAKPDCSSTASGKPTAVVGVVVCADATAAGDSPHQDSATVEAKPKDLKSHAILINSPYVSTDSQEVLQGPPVPHPHPVGPTPAPDLVDPAPGPAPVAPPSPEPVAPPGPKEQKATAAEPEAEAPPPRGWRRGRRGGRRRQALAPQPEQQQEGQQEGQQGAGGCGGLREFKRIIELTLEMAVTLLGGQHR